MCQALFPKLGKQQNKTSLVRYVSSWSSHSSRGTEKTINNNNGTS